MLDILQNLADTIEDGLRADPINLPVLLKNVETLQLVLRHLSPEAGPQSAPASDDPSLCGHPGPYFDLPGQTMCRTCGASQTEDGSWKVL